MYSIKIKKKVVFCVVRKWTHRCCVDQQDNRDDKGEDADAHGSFLDGSSSQWLAA